MRNFVDIEKSVEVIIYLAKANPDLFHIAKMLYFADKFHIEETGTQITGDRYIAMKDGPVPSGAYDIIKSVRGDGLARFGIPIEEAIRVENGKTIIPLRDPNMDYFSENNIRALDKAIEIYGHMSFGDLWRISHEEVPYQQARRNNDIELLAIIRDLENADTLLEYLES